MTDSPTHTLTLLFVVLGDRLLQQDIVHDAEGLGFCGSHVVVAIASLGDFLDGLLDSVRAATAESIDDDWTALLLERRARDCA